MTRWSKRRRCFRAQRAHETLGEYASRLLRFVLATGDTSILTDRQLELAEMGGAYAAAGVVGNDGRASQASIITTERISTARQQIALAVRGRRQQVPVLASTSTSTDQYPTAGSQKGRPAPLQPAPINRPPAGTYAGTPTTVF